MSSLINGITVYYIQLYHLCQPTQVLYIQLGAINSYW